MQAVEYRKINSDRKFLLEKLQDDDEFARGKLLGRIMNDEQIQSLVDFATSRSVEPKTSSSAAPIAEPLGEPL